MSCSTGKATRKTTINGIINKADDMLEPMIDRNLQAPAHVFSSVANDASLTAVGKMNESHFTIAAKRQRDACHAHY